MVLVVKGLSASAGGVRGAGLVPGSGGPPGGGHGNPPQSSCLENPHGQRSLVGYSPRGHRESDTTERLSTAHSPVSFKELKGEELCTLSRTPATQAFAAAS